MATFQTVASPQQQPTLPHLNSANSTLLLPLTASPTLDSKPTIRTKGRLPPTIEPSLIPFAHATKQSFSQAIADDQKAALQPDYYTSFQSANDIVKRLLPYHVWHVNEKDLQWTLDDSRAGKQDNSYAGVGKRKRDEDQSDGELFPTSEEAYSLFARYSKLHAQARKLRYQLTGGTSTSEGAPFSKESMYNIEKLAMEQEREILALEQDKLREAKEKAIEAGVRWEDLMRLGPTLAHAMSMAPGQGPSAGSGAGTSEATTPIATTSLSSNPFSPISFQKSVGSVQNGAGMGHSNRPSFQMSSNNGSSVAGIAGPSSAPTTPLSNIVKGSKPRGRPRKNRDEDGKIIATPPAIKPAVSQSKPHGTPTISRPIQTTNKPLANTTKDGASAGSNKILIPQSARPTPLKPIPATSPTPATASSATVIPTHPIPLVLPLYTLAQLSSLGIAPIPAPHLLPAISAQQAQAARQGQGHPPSIAITQSVHSTAPRPAPQNQVEPALLMGITEAPLPRNASSPTPTNQGRSTNTTTQQMLHVSVVLSKLSPSQLSGLAALMQSLQNSSSSNNKNTPNGGSSGSGGGSNDPKYSPSSSSRPQSSNNKAPSPR